MAQEHFFTGFTGETIDFLWELRMNNHKEWMEENRERYHDVLKEPFDLFAKELTECFLQNHKNLSMEYSVSRINRDVRFSKDKSPYKAIKWMVLREPLAVGERWQTRPVLYFELRPEGFACGMGIYAAKSAYMQAFRRKIDEMPKRFERLVKEIAKYAEFEVQGENYKRNMGKEEYNSEIMAWYQKKTLGLEAFFQINDILFERELLKTILAEWEKILPMYLFLREISV